MVRRRKARFTPNTEYLPWGLFDDKNVPELTAQVVQEVLGRLKVTDDAKKEEVRARLRRIAIEYWALRRGVEKPERDWYRKKVKPIRNAAAKLLKLLQQPREGLALSGLALLTERQMNRDLRRDSPVPGPQSVEELVKAFTKVCDTALKRQTGGARRQIHLEAAARGIAKLWEEFTGKPFRLSLDKAPGPSGETEFTYADPYFVHLILKDIDSKIEVAQITTALRRVLGGRPVENSSET
jgi:hypothetical protein